MKDKGAASADTKDYWAYSICSGCYNLCGVKIRVVEGVPISIEGVPESDLGGQGGMCGKGVATIMDFHDPNRIKYPVKRTNPKKGVYEDPKWERISWEEALDTIAQKLKPIVETDPEHLSRPPYIRVSFSLPAGVSIRPSAESGHNVVQQPTMRAL